MHSLQRSLLVGLLSTLAILCNAPLISPAQAEDGITILYDAFGKQPEMRKDWGFSALIEYQGKRILFDTGDNADIFAHNVKAKGIDLRTLDFAVISHRHSDHIAGIPYLLSINPDIKIYAPKENFGIFGSSLPSTFYHKNNSLPTEKRYFDGKPQDTMVFGTAWEKKFELIDKTTEVAPGIFLIALVSNNVGTLELKELSLAIKTPQGLMVIVGCSHPGIERIIEAATAIDAHIHMVVGGMHLVITPEKEVQRISLALRGTWKVDYIAPGHCTGEPAFEVMAKDFGDRYIYAGLGEKIKFDALVSTNTKRNSYDTPILSPEEKIVFRANAIAEIAER